MYSNFHERKTELIFYDFMTKVAKSPTRALSSRPILKEVNDNNCRSFLKICIVIFALTRKCLQHDARGIESFKITSKLT